MIGLCMVMGFGFLALVLLMAHDPPSGYNMGTGDSWGPFAICIVLVLVGVVFMNV